MSSALCPAGDRSLSYTDGTYFIHKAESGVTGKFYKALKCKHVQQAKMISFSPVLCYNSFHMDEKYRGKGTMDAFRCVIG